MLLFEGLYESLYLNIINSKIRSYKWIDSADKKIQTEKENNIVCMTWDTTF